MISFLIILIHIIFYTYINSAKGRIMKKCLLIIIFICLLFTIHSQNNEKCKVEVKFPDFVVQPSVIIYGNGDKEFKGLTELAFKEFFGYRTFNLKFGYDYNHYPPTFVFITTKNCKDKSEVIQKISKKIEKKLNFTIQKSYPNIDLWQFEVIDKIKFNKVFNRRHYSEYTFPTYEEQVKGNPNIDSFRFHPIDYVIGNTEYWPKVRSQFEGDTVNYSISVQMDGYLSNPDYTCSLSFSPLFFSDCKNFKEFSDKFQEKYGVKVTRKVGPIEHFDIYRNY